MSGKQIALLHVLARQKGLVDAQGDKTSYREWLSARFGVDSASKLSPQELSEAIDVLNGKLSGPNKWPGVRPADAYDKGDDSCEARAARAPDDKRPLMARIARLAWQKGGVGPWYVDGMARRMCGVQDYRWCTAPQLHKIASALQYAVNRLRKSSPPPRAGEG